MIVTNTLKREIYRPLEQLHRFSSWYEQEVLLTPAMTEAAALLERAYLKPVRRG